MTATRSSNRTNPTLPVRRGCCSSRDPYTMHAFTVTYDSSNHFQVLLSRWGSVWPRVLPYCCFNVALAAVLQYSKSYHHVHWPVTDKGHSYLTMLVSFLTVTRATVALGRYSQVRTALEQVYGMSRAVVDKMVIFSSDNINQSGKQWRHDVAYLVLIQLKSIMAVMDYQSNNGIAFWEMPDVDPILVAKLKGQLFLPNNAYSNSSNDDDVASTTEITTAGPLTTTTTTTTVITAAGGSTTLQFSHHAVVSEYEENMRVPVRLALQLRQAVISQRKRLDKPLVWTEESNLLSSIDALMSGYYGIRSFLTTPFPFPVVQMSRTFLFFYLFTVPFALTADVSNPAAHFILIFFLTFGFMGMEYASMELDDPFGEDANDFNNLRMAQITYEDCYTTIVDIDGEEWTDKLRIKMDSGKSDDLPPQATAWLHSSVEV